MEEILRFQQNMLLIRKALGWTAEEFGNYIGITRQTINNLEKNNRNKCKLNKTQYIAMRCVLDAEITMHPEKTETLQMILNVLVDYPEKYVNEEMRAFSINTGMMTSSFFAGGILSKELMENVGTIFNVVLSSANKGEKYKVGVWLDKILSPSRK